MLFDIGQYLNTIKSSFQKCKLKKKKICLCVVNICSVASNEATQLKCPEYDPCGIPQQHFAVIQHSKNQRPDEQVSCFLYYAAHTHTHVRALISYLKKNTIRC